MPESMPPPPFSEVPLEDKPFAFDGEKISDERALTMVIRMFDYAERERRQNYDFKWNEIEALYEGAIEQRYWPGSESQPGGPVPMASVPMNIAFDHVEGPLANIEAELFSNPEIFQLEQMAGASLQDVRDQQAVLERDLYEIDEDTFESGIGEIRTSLRGTLTYGNAIGLIEFRKGRNYVCDYDLKDVFIDPGTKKKGIDSSRFEIFRKRLTAEDVDEMREDEQFRGKIPANPILNWLINNPLTTQSDTTVTNTEAIRGNYYQPGTTDVTPVPELNPIVLYRYYDKKRIIYTLNNKIVIYNEKNPYGWLPSYSFVCREKKGRFYGTGYPEAVRWYQRMAEGLQNAHLNEVALAINPPTTGPPDASAASLQVYPGRKDTVEKPSDMIRFETSNITGSAFADIAQLIDQADRRNGVGLMSGASRPGNVRTKAGVDAQQAGTDARLAHVVKNVEEGLKIMLMKMRAMYRIHTHPDQILMKVIENGQERPIFAEVFHRPASIKIETVSTMLTRDRLAPMIQPVLQTYYNPMFIERQNQQGKTVADDEINTFIGKATGLGNVFEFIRPLNEQEQQALQQPPPQVVAQQQAKQGDQEIRREATQLKHQSEMTKHQVELQKAQIAKQPNPWEQQQSERESQMKMQEMVQKLAMQSQADQQKLQFQERKGMIDLMIQGQKMEVERQKAAQKQQQEAMNTQAQMQSHGMNMQMHREEMQERRMGAEMDLEMKRKQAMQPTRTGDEPKKPGKPKAK